LKKYILLSHFINLKTPSYCDSGIIEINTDRNIDNGDICNSSIIRLSNHTGTHIDCPYHFDQSGAKISDYEICDLIFKKPTLIDLSDITDHYISINDIDKHKFDIIDKDLILLRTGFERFRNEKKYMFDNPIVKAEVFYYLRENFPAVKAIGVDTISISGYNDREAGRAAHRAALCVNPRILLIEDMKLNALSTKTKLLTVFAAPIFIENMDAAPATVFAEVEINE